MSGNYGGGFRGFFVEAATSTTGPASSGPLAVSSDTTIRFIDPNGGITVQEGSIDVVFDLTGQQGAQGYQGIFRRARQRHP